jgi:hypothetical protein
MPSPRVTVAHRGQGYDHGGRPRMRAQIFILPIAAVPTSGLSALSQRDVDGRDKSPARTANKWFKPGDDTE